MPARGLAEEGVQEKDHTDIDVGPVRVRYSPAMSDALVEGAVAAAEARADDFARDGVVRLPGVLHPDEVARVQDLFDHGLAHPGAGANRAYPDSGATFYIDTFNMANWDAYVPAFRDTVVPDLVAALWRSSDVWFFYEQLFLKEGDMRRTPWHQDSSYLPVEGEHVAVVWIPLDPLDQWSSLEFARGSHRGPLYNTSAFDPTDDTRPIEDDPVLPRLPDVEAERDAWDIVSWPTVPGDVIVFHPNMLHGGGPTHGSARRRTVSLRYFGADAIMARRLGDDSSEGRQVRQSLIPALGDMKPGEPFRSPVFHKVR